MFDWIAALFGRRLTPSPPEYPAALRKKYTFTAQGLAARNAARAAKRKSKKLSALAKERFKDPVYAARMKEVQKKAVAASVAARKARRDAKEATQRGALAEKE